MLKSQLVALLAVTALTAPCLTIPSLAQDPLDVLVDSSPEVAASKAEVEAALAELKAARAAWLPSLRIEAQVGAQDQTLRLPTGAGTLVLGQGLNPRNARAIVQQRLYTSGVVSGSIGAAEATAEAAKFRQREVREEILLAGAIAIANVVRDAATLEVRIKNETVIEGRLEEALSRKNNGLATETDYRQSEARLASAKAQRIAARGALVQSRAEYMRYFGEEPQAALYFPEIPQDLPKTYEEAEAAAASENPRILAANSNIRAAQHRVTESRGRSLPQVSLNAEAAYAEDLQIGEFLGRAEQYGVFLNLSMDVFNGGANRSRLKASKRRVRAQELTFESTRRQVIESLIKAWSALEVSQAVLEARAEQVKASDAAREGVVLEGQVGRRTRLDVLDADLEAANARVDQITAERDHVVAAYRVLSLLGRL